MVDFYEVSYKDKGIEAAKKTKSDYYDIFTNEKGEPYSQHFGMLIANWYRTEWQYSNYTDYEALNISEKYYQYLIDVEPDNTIWRIYLFGIYEEAYHYGNIDNEKYFEKAEQLYRDYTPTDDVYDSMYINYELAVLYNDKWHNDLSDYKYYYMAEDTLYNTLDFQLQLEPNYTFSQYGLIDCYELLLDVYATKYELDGDDEGFNNLKNMMLEQVPVVYANEILYMENETNKPYKHNQKLLDLAIAYYYIWQLDTSDMQYFEKAEQIHLNVLELAPDYAQLFVLGEMYTKKWLMDKDDVQYKVKAIECFNELIESEPMMYNILKDEINDELKILGLY